MELNAEQIKKALTMCWDTTCTDCEFNDNCEGHWQVLENALSLINELTAENKLLNVELGNASSEILRLIDREKELTEENERLRKLNDEGDECPTCHGIGKIGTTNWLTNHLSKEQIAKEKAEAVAEYHRELKADTVRKMQERLRFEIINKPSEFRADQATVDFLNGSAHRQFEILESLDQIAKEMIENGN